jgi:phosphomannomutase
VLLVGTIALSRTLSHVYYCTIVGIVGGSDLPKQEEQLGAGVVDMFPYNFSQNGLVAYKNGKILEVQTIAKFLGEDNIKRIVNWVLKYLADVDIPVKVRMYVSTYT